MQETLLSQALNQRFINCPQYAKVLARWSRANRGEMNICGLADSAKSLLLAALIQEVQRPLFLVAQDNHKAAAYCQEIANLCPYPTFLYPSSELSPYEQVLSSADTVAGQMEVLEHIQESSDSPYVVVLPAKALLQRVLDQNTLKENTLSFKAGDEVNPSEIASALAEMGYTRENLVTLRGEFSVRGDIIDVFPSAGPPYRMELFGDEIESIRIFNIDTQRSVDKADLAIVPPRWWVVLKDRDRLVETLRQKADKAIEALSHEAGQTLESVMASDLPALEAGQYPQSAEYYAPYLHEELATIASYVPENALVLFDEWDTLSIGLESYEDKLNKTLEEGLQTGRLLPLPRPLHLRVSELTSALNGNQRTYLSSIPNVDDQSAVSSVEFDCHGVDRFNSQMQQFVEKIRQWKHDGFRIIVSTEQPQRILGILREWDMPGTYIPGVKDAAGGPVADTHVLPAGDNGGETKTDSEGTRYREIANEVLVTRNGFVSGFKLDDIKLVSVTDGELFGQKRKPASYRRSVSEKNYERFTSIADLKVGDYVVHIKQGIGKFQGIERIEVDNQTREYLTVEYRGEDRLYVPADQINLLSRYRGAGDSAPRLSKLGGAEWESTKRRVKRSVKQIAEDLVNLYAMRAKQEGFSSIADTPWQFEMEEAFPFEETPDQWQAIVNTKEDMESSKPMDRLICGDVGFGKTEVALRAIFKTVMSGKQAAMLVPTTILAQQHFNTLAERFAPYPVRVGLLSRFRTSKEQREVSRRLATGECDIVVGTHRLVQKDIAFKDLGLVVIDEEHRFGVTHKERLKQLRVMVDVLTMSATPIPRTLHMALSGVRDMSLINTPPVNRAPVKTFVGEYKDPLVRTAILHEMERGGQVYFVHNRVESIERIAASIKELVPEARIGIGHGQMQERELENIMLDFLAHEMDVLVCTTIIESGLDIPNVNTIIIDEADKLGLAQLYQLRGRVGRSDVQAYAYCLVRPDRILTESAQGRLKAIREFTSLGSGYQIAMRDMEIRGVGNILGAEQHGHMVAVGFDLYCKLLEDSVNELQGQARTYDADTQVDINVTAFIPENYMEHGEQKLVEYKRLADVRSEAELKVLMEEWKDRFGTLPQETQQLAKVVRLRLLASSLGITAIKPDNFGIRLSVDFRLQQWLPIQNRLPKRLASRTVYRPGSPGGAGPYILVKTEGMLPEDQLGLVEEIVDNMVVEKKKATATTEGSK